MTSPDDLQGMANLIQQIQAVLSVMASNKDEKKNVRELEKHLSDLSNHVKGFAQRLQQQQQAQQKQGQQQPGGNGAETAAKVQAMLIQAQTKAKIAEQSAANRTRQKDQQFQANERRQDQKFIADIGREGARTRHQLLADRMKALSE